MMSTANNSGGLDTGLLQETNSIGDNPTAVSTIGGDGGGGFDSEEAVRVSFSDAETVVAESTRGSKLENEDYQPNSSGNSKNNESRINGKKSQHKKVRRTTEDDRDLALMAFDEFSVGKGKDEGEVVGYGYEVGDMVWGKVKSHPWWPGHIYSEALASPSVRRSKREGHVLVAFFGDSSYGWFEPAELIPFEENFAEKSKQMFSKAFVYAVEESVDELSRRTGVGLVCRCRNRYNFWPSSVEGYFTVDVGDYEPGMYSFSQIRRARNNFCPSDMLSFVEKLALAPVKDRRSSIEFTKDRATVLTCRKARFEEFDETYAQAFGSVPVCPPRPTTPVVDPSKAPLSGRLVIAEALGKGKISAKPTKTKNQIEKGKYLFKWKDEPIQVKSKKVVGTHSLSVDGSKKKPFSGSMHKTSEFRVTDGENQTRHLSPNSEVSQKLSEGGTKKSKVHKRPIDELSSGNSIMVEKKKKKWKKEIGSENSVVIVKSHVDVGKSVANESVSVTPINVPLVDTNLVGTQKDVLEKSPTFPVETQQSADLRKFELLMLLRDLRGLALNPFHGDERCCPAIIRQVFWKYRSLVYKKSLISSPPLEKEPDESYSGKMPDAALSPSVSINLPNKIVKTVKIVKPSSRPDDPTKGGRKRGLVDHLEGIKKKKIDASEDVKKKKKIDASEDLKKKKKINEPEDIKKKKLNKPEDVEKRKKLNELEDNERKRVDYSKILGADEKKFPQSQRENLKEIATKNLPPKTVKLESSKKIEKPSRRVPNPTILIMKFQNNAALPSGAELRAKFARFGPLDHSATRVFWKSFQCRLVYHYKFDAEAALKFAIGSGNLFGNPNVRCYIREVEETESEPARVQKEDALKITGQPVQQLKSCLKKPAGEEGGNDGGRGGSRVKFVLSGVEESKKMTEGGGAPSSCTNVREDSSKNLPNFIPQLQKFPINTSTSNYEQENLLHRASFNANPAVEQISFALQNPTIDISQQMLNLLMKCSDVVNNLTGVLGYMPYHPI